MLGTNLVINADVLTEPFQVPKAVKEDIFGIGRLSASEADLTDDAMVICLHHDQTINTHSEIIHHFMGERWVALSPSVNLCIALTTRGSRACCCAATNAKWTPSKVVCTAGSKWKRRPTSCRLYFSLGT